ncbi:MAG TPA: nickel-type superoxide dismutase maturation protease [Candidatus Limnocylindria bacterium]|nr:nickel-type superoxide dismutase maturation protease [Candidatus Limnocylindria bacterium]
MRPLRGLTGPLVACLALIGALAAALAATVGRAFDVVEVRGRSMTPALSPGDRLLVLPLRRVPRVGEIVLASDPREPSRELVKRVAAVSGDRVTLRGDNPAASTDARTFGSVGVADVRWRAVARTWPPERIGPLRADLSPALESVDEGGEPACAFPEALIAGDETPR